MPDTTFDARYNAGLRAQIDSPLFGGGGFFGAAPSTAPPTHSADMTVKIALEQFAASSLPATRAVAARLALDRGFAADETIPLNTDIDIPAWHLFVGHARKLAAAVSGRVDPCVEMRQRHAAEEAERRKAREAQAQVVAAQYVGREYRAYDALSGPVISWADEPPTVQPHESTFAQLVRALGVTL